MIIKVNPEDLSEEIRKQLQDFGNSTVRMAVNNAVKDTAESAAAQLKKGGSYTDRSGKYSKDWEAVLRKGNYDSFTMTETYSVRNKSHYQLTHLLEKGHVGRNGSRVKAYEHIKPVEELAEQLVISNVGKRIREAQ